MGEPWESVLLNTDGEDLIYETPGDAQRGNPLDIVTVATCYTCEDVTGLKFPRKRVAERMARAWNTHAALLAVCRRALAAVEGADDPESALARELRAAVAEATGR